MSSIKEIIEAFLKELKDILREYVHETEDAVKKRLKKMLIMGITYSILLALVISLFGSAVLFLIIGQLKYLSTFMPVWAAWDIMGLTSAAIGALFLLVLYMIIRKQLKTNPKPN